MTPNLLMLGRETWFPLEVILGSGSTSTWEPVTVYGEYGDDLRDHMKGAHDIARKYLGKNALRMKRFDSLEAR